MPKYDYYRILGVSAFAFVMVVPLAFIINAFAATQSFDRLEDYAIESTSVTILHDNNPFAAGLTAEWGFSALVETEDQVILFDTGGSGKTLLSNMEQLGKDPGAITAVMISHGHVDHTGGLGKILEVHPRLKVFIPQSFPEDFSEAIRSHGAEVVRVGEPISILPGIYSTGEMGETIPEQALILSTIHGLLVITGCAHPGIVNVVTRAKVLLKKEVYIVLGGFHLMSKSHRDIERIIEAFQRMGVQRVAPCHCTGDLARRLFEKGYRDRFIRSGVGRVIRIGENQSGRRPSLSGRGDN